MDRSDLAIVIPCHDEAATIAAVVAGAVRFGEVLVVDDRSGDSSASVAREAGAKVMASAGPGYDAALETGLRAAYAAGYGYVVTMDADGEHDPALLAAFQDRFAAGAIFVCGRRPRAQRAAEHVAAWLGASLLGVHDPLCGMKGCSRRVLGLYLESGAPLLVNMAPLALWRRAGGEVEEVRIGGRRRVGQPRFGRALAANLAILTALWRVTRLRFAPGGDVDTPAQTASP